MIAIMKTITPILVLGILIMSCGIVSGDLIISASTASVTMETATQFTDVGSINITAGTLTANGTVAIYVGTNWSNSGTFNPGSGSTVYFNGSGGTQTITPGGSNFNNLTITNGTGSITFAAYFTCARFTADFNAGSTAPTLYFRALDEVIITVSSGLTLRGNTTLGQRLVLRRYLGSGTDCWDINPSGGTWTVSDVDVTDSQNLASSAIQPTGNNLGSPDGTTYNNWNWFTPTIVRLTSFYGLGLFGKVNLEWQTASEWQNAGFNLYRSNQPLTTNNEQLVKINQQLIPGLGTALRGKIYSFSDDSVTDGETYYYWLEDVDFTGHKTLHGPVVAHPGLDTDKDGMTNDWEIYYGLNPNQNDAQSNPDNDSFSNLEEFRNGTDPRSSKGNNTPLTPLNRGEPNNQQLTTNNEPPEGLRILSQDSSGMVLELVTKRFTTNNEQLTTNNGQQVTYQVLEIPGYSCANTAEAGKPQLPFKSALVAIPPNVACSLTEIDSEHVTMSNYQIYPIPNYQVEGRTYGKGLIYTPGAKKINSVEGPDTAFYAQDIYYPAPIVQLGSLKTIYNQRVMPVNFYPLQFNPARGEINFYKQITVKVAFNPIAPIGKQYTPAGNLISTAPKLKISVAQDGVYRLGYNTIWNAGFTDISWLDPRTLKLYYQGQEIPIRVVGETDGKFDLTDYIEFYGTTNQTKYSTKNVYWLTYSGSAGLRMTTQDAGLITQDPSITPTTFTHTEHLEKNDYYYEERQGDENTDRWFWDSPIWNGEQNDYTINLPDVNLTNPSLTATIKASYYGFFDVPANPDHHTKVYLNGTLIDDTFWDGEIEHITAVTVSQQTALVNGDNTFTIENILAPGTEADLIMPDWFEIEYGREFKAVTDTLVFSYTANGITQFIITGYTKADIAVFDITVPSGPKCISGVQTTQQLDLTWTLAFKDDFGGSINTKSYVALVITDQARVPVAITLDQPSSLKDTNNQADYIMIAHNNFKNSLVPLVQLHQNSGLKVMVVDVENIYDEFNYGVFSPVAIRDFLKYTYEHWRKPAPQYVLLVGDASYDYKNYLGYGQTNYVPTYLLPDTPYLGETGSDNWFVCLGDDNDFIPEMFIGRFPVRTITELENIINKIIDYNNTPTADWYKNILLVSDNEPTFTGINDALSSSLSSLRHTPAFNNNLLTKRYILPSEVFNAALTTIRKLYLGNYTAPSLFTDDLKTSIESGALWVNYVGHGATDIWTVQSAFDTTTIGTLNNTGKYPLVTSFTCLDGFYLHPYIYECMAESFLKKATSGAIACWSPLGMGLPAGHHILSQSLTNALFINNNIRLGPAITEAKMNLFATSGENYKDLIQTYTLFGDPALILKVKRPLLTKSFETGDDASTYESIMKRILINQ